MTRISDKRLCHEGHEEKIEMLDYECLRDESTDYADPPSHKAPAATGGQHGLKPILQF